MQDVQCGFCTFSDDLLLSIPQLCPGTRERTQPSVLCPGWTQISVSKVDTDADTESLCIWYCQTGGTGADVGCYNPAATDLTFGGGQWAHSPVGPRILPKIPTCILCNEHWRAFKGYFLCTFSSNLNSEKYSFGFWRLVGVSRALV